MLWARLRSRSREVTDEKNQKKNKTIVANCICSWLKFWRTWKYIFTFVLTNSKLILFYQPKSNSPQRKPKKLQSCRPTFQRSSARRSRYYFERDEESIKYFEEGPERLRRLVGRTYESLPCLPEPSPRPGLINLPEWRNAGDGFF